MKYILIAFFAMALNLASGQIVGQDWMTIPGGSGTVNAVTQRETDTVKVVLLVSDTAKHTFSLSGYYYDSRTGWIFGYSVREKHNQNERSSGNSYCWNCEDYWMHVQFLDDKKQPLKPTIIVWQSIEAKP